MSTSTKGVSGGEERVLLTVSRSRPAGGYTIYGHKRGKAQLKMVEKAYGKTRPPLQKPPTHDQSVATENQNATRIILLWHMIHYVKTRSCACRVLQCTVHIHQRRFYRNQGPSFHQQAIIFSKTNSPVISLSGAQKKRKKKIPV